MSDIAQSRNTLLSGLTISVIHAAALAVAAGAVLTACGGGAGDAPAPVAAGPGGYAIAPNCASRPAASLRFPYPRDTVVKIEGYDCPLTSGCDRHVLIVEQGACRLWESYSVTRIKASGQWSAYSTAGWDLRS